MRTLALSRLKQGFDSPRERHQINGLVGVCDAALWQWTTRWTSPGGIFTPKSVELISRCADPPPATPDVKRGRGRIFSPTEFSVCHFGRPGRRALVEKTGIWRSDRPSKPGFGSGNALSYPWEQNGCGAAAWHLDRAAATAGRARDAAGQPAASERCHRRLHRETEHVEKRELPQFGIPALC